MTQSDNSSRIDSSLTDSHIQRLVNVYSLSAELLRKPEVTQRLRLNPGTDEWSALQILGHMVEMIPYWLNHCQTLIAANEPPHFGRSLDAPERLAAVAPKALKDPELLLQLLKDEVEQASETIRAFSSADRQHKGIHISRGEMTVDEILESFVVGHAEAHLAQFQKALQV